MCNFHVEIDNRMDNVLLLLNLRLYYLLRALVIYFLQALRLDGDGRL